MSVPTVSDIDTIGAIGDPVIRNLRITQCYHELSRAVGERVAPGANWCTFATWASRQAGQTIRGEDFARAVDDILGSHDVAPMPPRPPRFQTVSVLASLPMVNDSCARHSARTAMRAAHLTTPNGRLCSCSATFSLASTSRRDSSRRFRRRSTRPSTPTPCGRHSFRCWHTRSDLFTAPFTAAQIAAMREADAPTEVSDR